MTVDDAKALKIFRHHLASNSSLTVKELRRIYCKDTNVDESRLTKQDRGQLKALMLKALQGLGNKSEDEEAGERVAPKPAKSKRKPRAPQPQTDSDDGNACGKDYDEDKEVSEQEEQEEAAGGSDSDFAPEQGAAKKKRKQASKPVQKRRAKAPPKRPKPRAVVSDSDDSASASEEDELQHQHTKRAAPAAATSSNGDSSGGESELEDNPAPKKSKRSTGTAKKTEGTGKRSSKAAESDEVKQYRKMVWKCGIRPKYNRLFADDMSNSAKVSTLRSLIKDFFRKIDFRGKLTMANCEKAKERHDAQKELADLDTANIIASNSGRRPRRAASRAARKNVQLTLREAETASEDEGEDSVVRGDEYGDGKGSDSREGGPGGKEGRRRAKRQQQQQRRSKAKAGSGKRRVLAARDGDGDSDSDSGSEVGSGALQNGTRNNDPMPRGKQQQRANVVESDSDDVGGGKFVERRTPQPQRDGEESDEQTASQRGALVDKEEGEEEADSEDDNEDDSDFDPDDYE